jgi:hypothetical protein
MDIQKKMNNMKRIVRLGALVLAAGGLGLQAQQAEGFKVGAALPWSQDSVRTYTHQSLMGLAVDGAYQGTLLGGGSFYRAGLGVVALPGKEEAGVKISLTDVQLFGDLVVPVGASQRLAVITGLSANNWSRSVTRPEGMGVSGNVRHSLGKLGFRAGLEYAITPKVTLSALLQMTELGTDSAFVKGGDPDYGTTKVNPSWIQVGFHYNF